MFEVLSSLGTLYLTLLTRAFRPLCILCSSMADVSKSSKVNGKGFQRRGSCNHFMASSDPHSCCPACRRKMKGPDACVQGRSCIPCEELRLLNRPYRSYAERKKKRRSLGRSSSQRTDTPHSVTQGRGRTLQSSSPPGRTSRRSRSGSRAQSRSPRDRYLSKGRRPGQRSTAHRSTGHSTGHRSKPDRSIGHRPHQSDHRSLPTTRKDRHTTDTRLSRRRAQDRSPVEEYYLHRHRRSSYRSSRSPVAPRRPAARDRYGHWVSAISPPRRSRHSPIPHDLADLEPVTDSASDISPWQERRPSHDESSVDLAHKPTRRGRRKRRRSPTPSLSESARSPVSSDPYRSRSISPLQEPPDSVVYRSLAEGPLHISLDSDQEPAEPEPSLVLEVEGETVTVNKDDTLDKPTDQIRDSQTPAPELLCPNSADHQKAVDLLFDVLSLPRPAPDAPISCTLATAPTGDKKTTRREALPPVYNNSFQFDSLSRKLLEDLSDTKFPAAPDLSKLFHPSDPLWKPSEQLANASFAHIQRGYLNNPDIKMSANHARLLERVTRHTLSCLNHSDMSLMASNKVIKGLLETHPDNEHLQQLITLNNFSVNALVQAVKNVIYNIVNITVLRRDSLIKKLNSAVPPALKHSLRCSPFTGPSLFREKDIAKAKKAVDKAKEGGYGQYLRRRDLDKNHQPAKVQDKSGESAKPRKASGTHKPKTQFKRPFRPKGQFKRSKPPPKKTD